MTMPHLLALLGILAAVIGLAHIAFGLCAAIFTKRCASRRVDSCRSCGYPLDGLRSGVCPECGEVHATGKGGLRDYVMSSLHHADRTMALGFVLVFISIMLFGARLMIWPFP